MKKAFNTTIALIVFLTTISFVNAEEGTPNSVFFPGDSNSYIEFDDLWTAEEFATEAITVAAWVKWNQIEGSPEWANILTYSRPGSHGDTGTFWLQHNQQNNRFEFAVQTDKGRTYVHSIARTAEQMENTWFHIVGVFTGNQVQIFVNGEREGNKGRNGTLNFNPDFRLNIGRWSNSGQQHRFFNGHIIMASIWDRGFNESEIIDLMLDTYNFKDENNSNLLGFWHLDDISGTHVPDQSQYGIHGTLSGNAQFTYTELPEPVIALPIELVSFTAIQSNDYVELNWITAAEINNDFFTLERSIDGTSWEVVTYINGAGDSNQMLTYQYRDYMPYEGVSYYRLTQTDFDGQFEVFAPIAANFIHGITPDVKVSVINNALYFNAHGDQLIIHDLMGRMIYSGPVQNGIQVQSQVVIVTIIDQNNQSTHTAKLVLN